MSELPLNSSRFAILAFVASLMLFGCGRDRNSSQQWEILLENQSAQPCNATVSFSGANSKGDASVDRVAAGQTVSLVASPDPTTVASVKIKTGGAEKALSPNAALKPGCRLTITIAPSGDVTTTMAER